MALQPLEASTVTSSVAIRTPRSPRPKQATKTAVLSDLKQPKEISVPVTGALDIGGSSGDPRRNEHDF